MTLGDFQEMAASDATMGTIAIVLGIISSFAYYVTARRRRAEPSGAALGVAFFIAASLVIPGQIILLTLSGAESIKLGIAARIALFLGAAMAAKLAWDRLMQHFGALNQPRQIQGRAIINAQGSVKARLTTAPTRDATDDPDDQQ